LMWPGRESWPLTSNNAVVNKTRINTTTPLHVLIAYCLIS
jgi:hypothetical protein